MPVNDTGAEGADDDDAYPPLAELQRQGRTAFDIRIDELEDAPWRRQGADLSDFFNYGFTEQAWRVYCLQQLRIRFDKDRCVHCIVLLVKREFMHTGARAAATVAAIAV
jgi:Fip1 motif